MRDFEFDTRPYRISVPSALPEQPCPSNAPQYRMQVASLTWDRDLALIPLQVAFGVMTVRPAVVACQVVAMWTHGVQSVKPHRCT